MKATIQISAKVWGWLPMFFWGIPGEYSMTVPTMDNFRQGVQLDEIYSANGETPDELLVTCSAQLYNPSPLSLVLHETVSFQVMYTWQDQEWRVGVVSVPAMHVQPQM